MLRRLNISQWSVVLRTQALVLFQVSLMVAGFVFVIGGLNAIDGELAQQQTLLSTQQQVLNQQSQSLVLQTNELNAQQGAIATQNDAIALQNAAFRVYQNYPLMVYWRLSAATTQLSSDLDNANQAEQRLLEAIAEISKLDDELAESTEVFMFDLEDFNRLTEEARTTIGSGDFVQGQRIISRTQTQVISMTTMLDVVIEIAQEVVANASQQVDVSSLSLTGSIAQTERDVKAVEASALDVAARIERVAVVSESINQRILAIVVVSVSIVLIVGFLLGRSISRPVNTLQQQIKKVSTNSDFTVKADDHRGDEIGAIARSLNQMIDSIRTMISDVRNASDEISNEADLQTRSNTQVQQALDTILLEVDSVAAAINQMTAAVQGINDLTSQAAEAAASGEEASLTGSQQVSLSSQRVQELNQELVTAEQRLYKLVEHTQKIYAVVDVIQGISAQTNLLALNAAIEAARAGEQGRGFAVVADEVRTLAQRTEQSTIEIKQMVSSFADEVNSTASQVKQSMQFAEASTEAAVNAQQSMDFLLATVKGIRELNSQISQSTQEQAEATSAVDSSVTRISTLVSDVKDRSDNTVTTMAKLKDMTDRLDTQVRRFKT